MSSPNCSYAIHNLGKRPIMTFIEFRDLPETLEEKWIQLYSQSKSRNISKFKVVSFLFGVSLTFFIVVSYILMWDRKGLVLTPSPFEHRLEVSSTVLEPEIPSETLDIKETIKLIHSKLDYPPRKLPKDTDIIRTDPELFSTIPQHFLPEVKSPCWYEEVPERSIDPYSRNRYKQMSKRFRNACDYLKNNFQQHIQHKEGQDYRLRCLPYFYIIGQPKCGTTDLYQRMLLHPEFRFNTIKEPHWWTRKRFGYIRFKDGFRRNYTREDYLDLFDLAAHKIQEGLNGNSEHNRTLQLITGEASVSTMWDNQAWSYVLNVDQGDPPYLTQDFVHKIQPNAKIIIMLRDPTERLYSDYLYFKKANKSAEDFHQKVMESVQLFKSCLLERSLRSCVYSTNLYNSMPVRLNMGMYIVFILDWLTVFPKEQILTLCLEGYSANIKGTFKKVFNFLKVGSVSKQVEAALTKKSKYNTRREADQKVGPMLPATRVLLRQFHQPFNHELAALLDNEAFLWNKP